MSTKPANLVRVETQKMTIGEKTVLYSMAEYTKGGDYCNLGDGREGGSSNIMALGFKEKGISGHIWTVDTYEAKKPFTPESVSEYSLKWGVEGYITRCVGTTFEYGEQHWVDRRFDFVFIDANHNYRFVRRDAENFMKLSNLIGFHDTNMESVTRAIETTGLLDWKLIHDVDTVKVFENVV